MKKAESKKSARLRYTQRIAELCGFKYDSKKNEYGRYLSVYELEKVADKLASQARSVDSLTQENARLEAENERLTKELEAISGEPEE